MYGLMFPGQGSQYVGMGKVFFDNFKIVQETFEEASDSLNQNMKKLIFEGPDSELKLTENTQPAILLVSTAIYRLCEDVFKSKTQAALGHSLGEYSALVAGNVLDFSDAIKAVKIRGRSMQKAVPEGKGSMMAVLGADSVTVEEICQWVQKHSNLGPIEPANFNAPGQIVISGSADAINYLKDHFKESTLSSKIKAKFIPLNVSAPFHCSLMKPAQDEMEPILNSIPFRKSIFPIIQNVTAQETSDPTILRNNLILQISAPVKWEQSVNVAKNLGIQTLIEVGAGKVLAGLVKKIDSSRLTTFNIETIEDFKKIETLQ